MFDRFLAKIAIRYLGVHGVRHQIKLDKLFKFMTLNGLGSDNRGGTI